MGNIHINIKLFAMLQGGRFGTKKDEFPVGTTVDDIIQRLGIPEKEVTLIFINGRHGQGNTQLMDGDTVALFPPVGGG